MNKTIPIQPILPGSELETVINALADRLSQYMAITGSKEVMYIYSCAANHGLAYTGPQVANRDTKLLLEQLQAWVTYNKNE